MDKSSSFLALNSDGEEKCLLCECILKKKDKISLFKYDRWLNVQEQAKRWSTINIDNDDSKYPFTKVYERINNVGAFGKAHTACRTPFRTKVENYERKFGLVEDEESNAVADSLGEPQNEDRVSRRSSSQHLKEKRLCFICNVKQSLDNNHMKVEAWGVLKGANQQIGYWKEKRSIFMIRNTIFMPQLTDYNWSPVDSLTISLLSIYTITSRVT